MDIHTLYCSLCSKSCNLLAYNLKRAKSLHSDTPLIVLLEHVDNLSLLFFDICEECYQLLNELDALNVRTNKIRTILKDYISSSNKLQSLSNDISNQNIEDDYENIIPVQSEQESVILTNVIDNFKGGIITNAWKETEYESMDNLKVQEIYCSNDQVLKQNETQNLETVEISSIVLPTGEPSDNLNFPDLSHKEDTPFICEICGQCYKQKSQFNIHMEMHNGSNPFVCVYCDKSFTQKIGLIRHVAKHTGEKPYQCEECGKTFAYHTSFNAHKQTHKGVKNFKCSSCASEFMSMSHLKRHSRVHTGEKRFACHICSKRFAERYNLVAHEKIHLYANSDVCPLKRKLK